MEGTDLFDLSDTFPGESHMAQIMRDMDWCATPLGSPNDWPEGLKTPLRMLLTSRFEMWLGWGPQLRFFYNDAYVPTLGIKHPSSLGQPFQEVWSEVYDDVADQVEQVRAGKATWNKALLLLLERSGYPEETYHSFSYSPLFDGDGSVAGMLCVVTEETERVISERKLATLEKLGTQLVSAHDWSGLRSSFCQAMQTNRHDFPFVLVELFGEPHFTFSCSDDAEELVQYAWPQVEKPEEELLVELDPLIEWPKGAWDRMPTQALVVPILGPESEMAFGRMIVGLNPYRLRSDTSIAEFARLIAGQLSGALANIATLQTEKRRGDRIWLHARDLMLVIDPNGIIRSASPASMRILGYEAEVLVGQHIRQLVYADDVHAAMEAFYQAALKGDLTSYESRLLTSDGGNRSISWHTAMEDGLVYAYGRDITEQKIKAEALALAEDALRQAQKMEAIGQLTGGVAHDFNNLLTVIRSSAELLGRADLPDAKRKRYIDAISETSERAAKLTSQLLAFARRQSLKPEVFSVPNCINSIADMLRTILGSRVQLQIISLCGDSDCFVEADANQFETAIINMAVNARDAMKEEGSLTIRIQQVRGLPALRGHSAHMGEFIAVSLIDNGEGIHQHHVDRIFEPFFTTKDVGKGTGLGLSQVYGFAKQSGGDLNVESTVGTGTTFTLFLPRVPALAETDTSHDMIAALNGTGRVLVVEDNVEVGEFVTHILEDLGYQTVLARNAAAALEILESDDQKFDLLFSDVVMPGVSGIELGRAVRTRWPDLPIVLTSGYSQILAEDSQHGFDLLRKPYSIGELAEAIKAGRHRKR